LENADNLYLERKLKFPGGFAAFSLELENRVNRKFLVEI
jgi:hypothetical protein